MGTGLAVVAATVLVGVGLLRPQLRASTNWRATVTPLASIIGSGFLVVAPLLAATVGSWAPVAMTGIVMVAFWVGSGMRFVIAEVEPRLRAGEASRPVVDLDRLSRLLLGFAYVVSVAFYVRMMASFVLRSFGDGDLAARLVTTIVLSVIGVAGWRRGLDGLEVVEELAVGVKLAIIAGLLVGLLVLGLGDPSAVVDAYQGGGVDPGGWTTVRVLAGMLLVVQGFETSRYLGEHYDAPTRIKSMRRAQLLSGSIYVLFVALCVRTFDGLPSRVDETAILDMADEVTRVLVPLLVIAAVASQLSAAVADTAGGGEMFSGFSRRMPSARIGYVAVIGAAIAVVWLADVLAIISLASRAFAAFYLFQTLMACLVLVGDRSIGNRTVRLVSNVVLLVVLGFVVVLAIPADS